MKIAFIGGGNMARSLIGGLVPEIFSAQQVTAFDINDNIIDKLMSDFSINGETQFNPSIHTFDIVLLAVKPQAMQSVCELLKPNLKGFKGVIISVAAGITSESIDTWLGESFAIVRCMPNTPALLNCGATGLFANSKVNETQKQTAFSILEAVGIAVWVDTESEIDIVTALSGSGPAYFFLFIESLQNAAIKLGLNSEKAQKLAVQTALGAAKMAFQNNDIEKLRNNVTSKGGTTEQALLSFDKNDLSGTVNKAVTAAYKRSQQLAIELAK